MVLELILWISVNTAMRGPNEEILLILVCLLHFWSTLSQKTPSVDIRWESNHRYKN
jgi:hypothetical protein